MHSERANAAGWDDDHIGPATTVRSAVESGPTSLGHGRHVGKCSSVERGDREGPGAHREERSYDGASERKNDRLYHEFTSFISLWIKEGGNIAESFPVPQTGDRRCRHGTVMSRAYGIAA